LPVGPTRTLHEFEFRLTEQEAMDMEKEHIVYRAIVSYSDIFGIEHKTEIASYFSTGKRRLVNMRRYSEFT
jgi:hypothetical protein